MRDITVWVPIITGGGDNAKSGGGRRDAGAVGCSEEGKNAVSHVFLCGRDILRGGTEMAIETVRAQVNGQWHMLTLNPENGHYEATITAPATTSWGQPDHTYNVVVEATNDAGTTATADGDDLPGLKLRVLEKVAPVITILSPFRQGVCEQQQATGDVYRYG